jgi:hypothetical protein
MANPRRNGSRARRPGTQEHRQRAAPPPQRARRYRRRSHLHGPRRRSHHAYDKDTGKILWETAIEANPEGLVSTFEINGGQYVAFCASGTADENTQTGQNAAWLPGILSAQGYSVYALPQGTK